MKLVSLNQLNYIVIFIRPLDIDVSGLRFYRDSIFYFCLFLGYSATLIFTFYYYCQTSANGTQPKPATCWEVTAI